MAELVLHTVRHMTDLELEALDAALAQMGDEEVGPTLVRSVHFRSFNPQVKLTRRLVARSSPTHINEAFAHVAFALYRTQPVPELEHFNVLEALLAAGARADWRPAELLPALHSLAACWGVTPFDNHKKSLAKKIEKVTKRADAVFDQAVREAQEVDLVDERGWTALHHAVLNSRIQRVERLLAAGASKDLKTADGHDAVALARMSSAAALPAILAALGAA
jgi:ankyrin repeat protein